MARPLGAAVGSGFPLFRTFPVPYATFVVGAAILAVAFFVTGPILDKEEAETLAWKASDRPLGEEGSWEPFFLSMLVHGNLVHLVFNTASLFAYGVFLERVIGPVRFLLIFALAGIAGHLAHGAARPETPIVGASGAIFGLMGVLVILQPRAEAEFFGVPMSLLFFAALYTAFVPFLAQLTNVLPLAHEAHLGGMFLGIAAAFLIRPRRALLFAPGIVVAFLGVYQLVVFGFEYGPRIANGGEPLAIEEWLLVAGAILVTVGAFAWVRWIDTSYREARCAQCGSRVGVYNLRRVDRLEACGSCGAPVRLSGASPVVEEEG